MAQVNVEKIRSVAIVAHSGAGKTSLADALLYAAGANSRLGKVNDGTSICDYNEDEIERKITINSKPMHLDWQEARIYLVDTPGYADFIGEVFSTLTVCDSGLLVIDAASGVEVGSERVWGLLNKHNLPRAIFVNKLDKENTDFLTALSEIKKHLGKQCLALQFPNGKEADFKAVVNLLDQQGLKSLSDSDQAKAAQLRKDLVEALAECNDALLEQYLEGKELTLEQLNQALRPAVLSGKIIPVFCGAATQELGVKELLTGIVDLLNSPLDKEKIVGADPSTKQPKEIKPSSDGSFYAQVFKTILDPYVGQLTLFKVFSGNLGANSGFYNSSKMVKERIGKLYLLQGKEQQSVESVSCGDIAAVAKLKETATGDTLCSEKDQIIFSPIIFPEPAISSSVKPKSRSDEEKISTALTKLTNEDPTFKVSRDQVTKELIISGIGDLHLDVMVNRLKKKFEVEVELGVPKVAYKETITKNTKAQGKYKKQSGGRGQYGDVWLEVEPLRTGDNFEFVDKLFGGSVPKNYVPSVEKGVKQAMSEGILAGYPLVNMRVIIYDGSYHPVDSSDMAFQIAGAMALRKCAQEASPVLLEPIMDVEVLVPDEFMGQISADLSSRRGRILGMDVRSGMQVVKAQVPLAEIFKYATDLRSMTQGRASYSMKFTRYDQVPQKIAATIIEKAKKEKEEKNN
ncbi:MAG: elongation factor G [Candidatus Omnitrophica bacterium]|nr:elongation factor G [Candidatus Omnitrophota bacterium]